MKQRHSIMILIVLSLILTQDSLSRADQNNSLFGHKDKAESHAAMNVAINSPPASPVVSPGGTSGPETASTGEYKSGNKKETRVLKASWIAVAEPNPKEFRVHDLITIVVHEVSQSSTKANTKSEKDLTFNAKIADWLRLTDGNLRPDKQRNGDPTVDLSLQRELEGKNDIKREDKLMTRIQAEIIDILPNGNLVMEAKHKVTTDEDSTTITLTGICRSKDVGTDNTILSNQLANLDVKKEHEGSAKDTNKRGWLTKFLEKVSPF